LFLLFPTCWYHPPAGKARIDQQAIFSIGKLHYPAASSNTS